MDPTMDPWASMAGQSSSSSGNFYQHAPAQSDTNWYSGGLDQLQVPQLDGPSNVVPNVDGATTSFIGVPVHFTEGRFAGETIYASLEEIQRPEYGRRFGSVDRRVLDDPPVVQLRIFYVHNARTSQMYSVEVEDYETVALAGLVCMVDLFEVGAPSADSDAETGPPLTTVDGHPITEAGKRTQYLFGTTFVEAYLVKVPDKEKKKLLFTFSDLAVRLEGQFILRYRFFDVLARPTGYAHPTVLAEHYGGVFTVYSTKSAPALKESTELTKALGRHSVPVNIRKKQRAPRRKVTDSASPSLSADSSGTS